MAACLFSVLSFIMFCSLMSHEEHRIHLGHKQPQKEQKAVALTLNMKVIHALDISSCGVVCRDEATQVPHKELHHL